MQRVGASTLLAVAVATGIPSCDRNGDSTEESATEKTASGGPASLVDIPTDQSQSGWTKRQQYFVEVVPVPNPIPFQELFELEVRVWHSEAANRPVEEAELDSIRARMPAHDHGMKTDPEVERSGPGIFRVRGVRFHMQGLGEDGRWVIELVIDGPEGLDRARFPVYCCRP